MPLYTFAGGHSKRASVFLHYCWIPKGTWLAKCLKENAGLGGISAGSVNYPFHSGSHWGRGESYKEITGNTNLSCAGRGRPLGLPYIQCKFRAVAMLRQREGFPLDPSKGQQPQWIYSELHLQFWWHNYKYSRAALSCSILHKKWGWDLA